MLSDTTVSEFTSLLASDAPAPGGGSAAALMGALGVSLTTMVAALTVGKSRYAAYHTQMRDIQREAEKLRLELLELINSDTDAFNQLMAAYALPKGDEQEMQVREGAIQTALRTCTETPYRMMCVSMQALRLTEQAMEGYNTNASSDLGVAALGLGAAIRGAWLNILANLGSIADTSFSARYQAESQALIADALPMAERVYQVVLESL